KQLKQVWVRMIDRLVIRPDIETRLTDSVETALREGKGLLVVTDAEGKKESDRFYSEHNACHVCGLSFPDLSPQSFSFNSPLGMCRECNGLGSRPQMDPDLVVPDPSPWSRAGAVAPWADSLARGDGGTVDFVQQLATAFDNALDVPWSKLPKKKRDIVLDGSSTPVVVTWKDARGSGRYRMEW